MKEAKIKKVVKERYAKAAKQGSSCCPPENSCCGSTVSLGEISQKRGYTEENLKSVPEGANLGLGCGNPVAVASLKEGEIVLDLGSGAGIDCFLAANKVGKTGRVIGVDMTLEMIERARENARKGGYTNVEFRLGEIENLPVADNSVDVVISNCVINLVPDKRKAFKEAFRVLKPGGRLMVSDIVLIEELPDFIKNSMELYVHCVSGAMMKDEYLGAVKAAGFREVSIIDETPFRFEHMANDPIVKAITHDLGIPSEEVREVSGSVTSIKVCGLKPKG